MKLWAGRFQKETDTLVNDFNSSIGFDARLYEQDIRGSMAHAAMLGRTGVIEQHEAEKIVEGLQAILADIEADQVEFSLDNEDIHMNIEALLTERIGQTGKRLHTARSRNDQVATDFRLYVKEEIPHIIGLVLDLEKVLVKKAKANLGTVMPGYTHLQRAQPTTFGHYMMAYANMLKRDVTRLEDCMERMDECPLGSGALATSTYPVDRFQTAAELGFRKPTDNSMDSVSDRDYAIELLSALSILMMHLSRFSEEIILWCSWEFKFVELDDAYSTGSSIMPQKKNPDVAELVRGKTGRVYGSLITLLTVMKGLPLAYNKDMQEDKEPVFDAIDTVELCVPVFSAMLDTLTVKDKNMARAASVGFINATDCADYLVKKGMPFREAYMIVGRLVHMCIRTGESLDTLPLKDFRAISGLFDESVYDALQLKTCVNERKVYGGPSEESVKKQIELIEEFVAQRRVEADMELLPFFKSVLEQDRSPVVLCDLEHTVIYMNPVAGERYARQGGMALVGKSLLSCHSPQANEMIRKVVAWFQESAEHNLIYTFRNEEENKDVYMVALRDDSGTLIGYYEKHEYRNRETMEKYDFKP